MVDGFGRVHEGEVDRHSKVVDELVKLVVVNARVDTIKVDAENKVVDELLELVVVDVPVITVEIDGNRRCQRKKLKPTS